MEPLIHSVHHLFLQDQRHWRCGLAFGGRTHQHPRRPLGFKLCVERSWRIGLPRILPTRLPGVFQQRVRLHAACAAVAVIIYKCANQCSRAIDGNITGLLSKRARSYFGITAVRPRLHFLRKSRITPCTLTWVGCAPRAHLSPMWGSPLYRTSMFDHDSGSVRTVHPNLRLPCGSTWDFGTPDVLSNCCTNVTSIPSTVTNGDQVGKPSPDRGYSLTGVATAASAARS